MIHFGIDLPEILLRCVALITGRSPIHANATHPALLSLWFRSGIEHKFLPGLYSPSRIPEKMACWIWGGGEI
jgi:hypothetical protein